MWTEDDFAGAMIPGELRPDRGPQRAPTRIPVSIRLDRDVVDRFKADGPGRQARMNETLRRSVA